MKKARQKTERFMLLALFGLYLIVLFRITVFRNTAGVQYANVIPFITIGEYIQSVISGNRTTGMINILGNLMMFFPLGYMCAVLFPGLRRLTRVLLTAFTVSLFIEIIQYTLASGRADIDDVILNTLGGAVGYGIYLVAARVCKPRRYAVCISTVLIAFTCLGLLTVHTPLRNRPAPGGSLARNADERTVPEVQAATSMPVSTETATHVEDKPEDIPMAMPEAVSTASEEAPWQLILVNKWHYMPEDYAVELIEVENEQSVDKRIFPALQDMLDSARNDNIYPIVVSGYRTAEQQQNLLDEKIAAYKAEGSTDEEAVALAEAWVALPGTSEHQLGIAVDINADGIHSAGYEVYEWLEQNAYRFGFIGRYPADKTDITGVISEPWHYRYVGVEAAADIYRQGICLEEYIP